MTAALASFFLSSRCAQGLRWGHEMDGGTIGRNRSRDGVISDEGASQHRMNFRHPQAATPGGPAARLTR